MFLQALYAFKRINSKEKLCVLIIITELETMEKEITETLKNYLQLFLKHERLDIYHIWGSNSFH